MAHIRVHNQVGDIDWLVCQYESYRFEDASLSDKFFPRPYVSLIFHFKDPALIYDTDDIKLDPYFLAPVVAKAFELKFEGDIDTFAVTCKATVFSRLFQVDLSPHPSRSIPLPATLFLPLWKNLQKLQSPEDRTNCFLSL